MNRGELKSAVIGMVIGDGCLSKHQKKDTHNAYFQCHHCAEQFLYVMWKKRILDNISKCKIWRNDKVTKDGKVYRGHRLYSRTNPLYTTLYNRFYQVEGKSLDEYIVKMITPLALAIMYMDDGTVAKPGPNVKNKQNSYFLRLCSYDFANLTLVKKSLKIKYDQEWNVIKHGSAGKTFWQLRLRNKDNDKFIDLIKPYVIPSMEYKLGSDANTPKLAT